MISYKNNILLFGGSGFLGNNFSNLLKNKIMITQLYLPKTLI